MSDTSEAITNDRAGADPTYDAQMRAEGAGGNVAGATLEDVSTSGTGPTAGRALSLPVGVLESDERVGTVLTDRVCTRCYFNLVSQPVIRERHYGLLVVRCPECGTLASVQEYPHLSRWSRRFVAVLVIAWLVFLLLSLLASGYVLKSSSESLVSIAAEPGAQKMAEAHLEYQKQKAQYQYPQPAQTNSNWYVNQPATVWSQIDPGFTESYPTAMFFEQAGGWGSIWQRRLYSNWIVNGFGALVIGVCWSIVLPHARRWKRLLAVIPVLSIGWLFAYLNPPAQMWVSWGGWQYANYLMQAEISRTIAFVSIATLSVPLVVGVYIGRGVARLGVRMLLPPRFREPMYFLWLADGYPVPTFKK